MLPLQLLGLRQRAGVHHAGIQHGLTITDPAQHLEKTDGEKQDCETAQDCTSESPPPVTDGFFFFFFPQLNVWAPLCRMMRVQGLTLICDITDNLESNCGPIFSRHRCDVETCEVEHLLCLAVTFWICKKKKKSVHIHIFWMFSLRWRKRCHSTFQWLQLTNYTRFIRNHVRRRFENF